MDNLLWDRSEPRSQTSILNFVKCTRISKYVRGVRAKALTPLSLLISIAQLPTFG
ncbi:hypothetical protein LNA01_10030 [Companilactobacillus nantensis]|nr:hypothetical protein LNA01_10030 [Companilactobacillus nantensis]